MHKTQLSASKKLFEINYIKGFFSGFFFFIFSNLVFIIESLCMLGGLG